ncbi:MAG: Mur ligase domain-containing protein, partial [Chitinophagaceae bacterium]
MQDTLVSYHRIFFIGIAGAGMSAVAQYLQGIGKEVSGSDRYFIPGADQTIRHQLEQEGIRCYAQDGSGFASNPELVVVSTAIEDTVPEVRLAKERKIPIIKRSTLLSWITQTRRTIAVAGTSGKSTTAAMLFHILDRCGLEPGIITGAGLIPLIKQGKIGNAKVGKG